MPQATFESRATLYEDVLNDSNPLLKYADWKRSLTKIPVGSVPPGGQFVLAPGATQTVVTGTIADVTADTFATGYFASAKPSWLIIKDTGILLNTLTTSIAGVGNAISFLPQPYGTCYMQWEPNSASGFATLQPGDLVFVNGSTYDSAISDVFAAGNQGYWTVVRVDVNPSHSQPASRIVLQRGDASDPTGTSESSIVSVAATDIQRIAAGSAPSLAYIRGASSGLAYSGLRTIVAVAKGWVAITGTAAMPPLASVTFTEFLLATNFIMWFRVEANQPVLVTADTQKMRLLPCGATDAINQVGWLEQFGLVGTLSVTNASAQSATISVIIANKT